MALCMKEEIVRLEVIINNIGGNTRSIGQALNQRINDAITGLNQLEGQDNNFRLMRLGLIQTISINNTPINNYSFDQIIDYMSNNIQADLELIDNYAHYKVILRNLNYNINQNNWRLNFVPTMAVADAPYAISAMQDTREIVRNAVQNHITTNNLQGANARNYWSQSGVYSLNNGYVSIGGRFTQLGALKGFSLDQIHGHIRTFYTGFSNFSNQNPSPYTNAATELVDEMGPYCSYCEANLKTQIDVEHLLPKGIGESIGRVLQGFSPHSKSWYNFLPACPRCNSTKNAHPSKIDITKAANGQNVTKDDKRVIQNGIAVSIGVNSRTHQNDQGGDIRLNDNEYDRIFDDYFQFPLEENSYLNVGFNLQRITFDQNGQAVDNNVNLNVFNNPWNISRINEYNKTVEITFPNANPITTNSYRLYIDTTGNGQIQTPQNAVAKVRNMVSICGLNATNSNTDRRVLERTEAFFMAMAAVKQINISIGVLPINASAAFKVLLYENWRSGLVNSIKEKGFFSVWLKTLVRFNHPLAGLGNPNEPRFPTPLHARVVRGAQAGQLMSLAQDVANQLMIKGYFPNTNWAQVP